MLLAIFARLREGVSRLPSFRAMKDDPRWSGVAGPAAQSLGRARSMLRRRFTGSWGGNLLIRRLLSGLAVAFVGVSLLAIATAVWALHDVPLASVISGTTEPTVVLEASDGQAMVQKGPYQGSYADLADFPEHLVQAVLSIEDRRFYSHSGIDLRGISRAFVRNILAGEVVEGGSTITQQLIKVLYLERDRTLKRKLQEVFLAFWIENRLGKDEVLTRYLNNIYLGAGATGMPAAALVYFGKSVGELTLAESAMLAGLIRAPSQLNPLENLEGAKERAAVVLAAMADAEYLDDASTARAQSASAVLSPTRPDMSAGTWFADWVISEAREIAGPFRGTIKVKTTLDPQLQSLAEQAVTQALDALGETQGVSQAALVALRPDGAVVAMVGGRNYETSEFNRAVTAKRQPGSIFKLFVYYAALRQGLSPNDRIEDAPIEIDGWTPENFGGEFNGRVTLAEAFARSLNAATVRLAMEVGIDEVIAAARDLGIDAPLNAMPSLALGASEVSLMDLTGAYASVRAGRTPIEPWGISTFAADQQSQSFRVGPSTLPQRELAEHHESLVSLLQLVVERGTGQEAALDGFAAGKTGTSQESRDAWFIGFNEALTVGVWVGNDDGTPMNDVTGGQMPASIWKAFMNAAAGSPTPTGPVSSNSVPRAAPSVSPGVDTPPSSITDLMARTGAQDAAPVAPSCNVRACSRAYRSFRSSDCTFQPYRGSRKLCDR
ncbi:PBP1A family penicillin-binding protein [Aurantimonas sp. A2-1-M11]